MRLLKKDHILQGVIFRVTFNRDHPALDSTDYLIISENLEREGSLAWICGNFLSLRSLSDIHVSPLVVIPKRISW